MNRSSVPSDKMQSALAEVRNIYVDLAQRPIERNCLRQSKYCHFKLTGRTPYPTKAKRSSPRKLFAPAGEKHSRKMLMDRVRCFMQKQAIA
jgi:hypothetical protein